MPTTGFDSALSEILLNFRDYPETISIDFNTEIVRLYNQPPIYFSPEPNVEINTQLRAFTDSSQFTIFITQLEICFSRIAAFININNIRVQTTIPALTGDPSGQRHIEINANNLLRRFLERLRSDYYADGRASLYADGKRYLEMLSILIEQPAINLDDRITQVKALIDEDALERCADGGYSRLQETVENLEAITIFDVYKWIKTFLKNQLIESIQKSISSLTDATVTEKIADIIGRPMAGFEIHYHNWMVEILRKKLGFSFIRESRDAYVNWITNELDKPENSNKKIKVLAIVEQVKEKLIQSITATHLVEFISHRIYQLIKEQEASLELSVRYSELVNSIEVKLAVLGADDTFSLGEIFDINGEIKFEVSLYKTITLRLLNAHFFRQPLQFSTEHYQLQIFEKNLQLNLIKILNNGEVLRIVDFIQQPGALSQLLSSVTAEKRIGLFNNLIQSTEDFIIFLNNAHHDSLSSVTQLLSETLHALGHSITDLMAIAHEPLFLSKFKAIFIILEKLDGSLVESKTAKHFFYEQIITPHFFQRILRQYLELRLRLIDPDKYSVIEVQTVLEKLLVMQIADLNQITFFEPKFASLDLQRKAPSTYLADLNFFQVKLQEINVEVPVDSCEFEEAEIRQSHFFRSVSYADFTKAKLEDVHFKELKFTSLYKTQFIFSKVYEEMINCNAQKAIFDGSKINKAKEVIFSLASLKKIQLNEVEECNFSGTKLKDTDILSARACKFIGAKLENVSFAKIIDNKSSSKVLFSFKYAEFKKVSFSLIVLQRDKVDFSYTKIEDSIFKLLDLRQAIFEGTEFKNVRFEQTNFNKVTFENIKFSGEVRFDNCYLTEVIFRNCDLSKVDINENNLLGGAKLEGVTLTPYQLIKCHSSHIVDYSKVTLVDDPVKTELEIEKFLLRSKLDGAILSTQVFNYLYDKGFCFSGVDLQQVDFEAIHLTNINLEGTTITLTQALKLHEQGLGNFSQTTIVIDPNSIEKNLQKFKAFMKRNEEANEEAKENDIEFLIFLFEKVNNDLVAKTLNNEALIAKAKGGLPDQAVGDEGLMAIANMQQKVEAQRQAFGEIAKIIFTEFDAEQQQIILEKMTQLALQRDALGEGMAAEQLRSLRSAVLTSLSQEVLSYHITFFSNKFFQTSASDETTVLNELLNEIMIAIASRCVDLGRRKKRSQAECTRLVKELITVDEAHSAVQPKEIALLVAAERRLFWQKTITSLLDELNHEGEQWFPLLETAKDLGNDHEAIEFVNVQTHEKQTRELPGKSSLDFLASLRELHNFIPQKKFRENVKNLADNLKVSHPLEQAENSNDHFSGDFMLAIGLTSKTIINLINNKSCMDKVSPSSSSAETEKAECAINIAGMSVLYLTSALQLTELIGKDFLTQDSLLLKGLSATSKSLGGINIIFLFIQDGFDIAKLVNAKSEGESAVYATQLVIDGTLTAQTLVSLTTEGLLSAASGALVVPFIGLGAALPSLVQNYETLLQKALDTGRFFNSLHEQQKKGGYELVTQTKVKDDKGNEQITLLNVTQRFMKPVDMVGITKIDFRNKLFMLEGPWVYSSMNKGNCYYVDHHKKNAFDFREGVSLSKIVALSEIQLASKTWLLPLPNFYINYQYQQVPGITYRRDAELTTLRELQRAKKFISDEYCFPAWYGIYKYEIEYVPTTIKMVADKLTRTFIVPKLDNKLQGFLSYQIDTRGLASGQGIIYLNPGVSMQLYLTNYSWVLNGQNLPQDTIEFTQHSLKIGDVNMQRLVQISFIFLDTVSANDIGSLTYINRQGHGFQLELTRKQIILITINYAALQKEQQTLEEFLTHQKTDSPTLRVVNYSNSQDGYQGTATYVVAKRKLFYTSDIPKHLNDAILIALQKETAFFYDAENSLLWCTDTKVNRLLHYYVFPEKIYSVHLQGNDLRINVKGRFYYRIDTETKKSLLVAIKDSRLLSKINAVNTDIEANHTREVISELQDLIRSTFSDAKQTSRVYQPISEKTIAPDINDASVALQVTANDLPYIWFRKEEEKYQIISMQTAKLDAKPIGDRGYPNTNIKYGYYLGCFLDNSQANTRRLSFFVKENSSDITGKLYLQTVNSQQAVVSFQNTPPKLIVDFPVKNAVWDKNRLVVLTTEGIYQEIDALAHISIIGFSAEWTQLHPDWWQAVAVYLETQDTKQALIAVQGVKDQQGNDVTVYYDPRAQQFVVINSANVGVVYSGKVAEVYFFIKDNCAYQTQGLTLKQIEDLFNGLHANQSLPTLTKIADYYPLKPLEIPTENDLLLMQELPQFSVTLQDFRILIPHGVELAFDIKDETWCVIAIKAGWFNKQKDPLIAVSELFDQITKVFKLKEKQLNTPIPIESTNFCLVENDRFMEIPGVRWPSNQVCYLGQTDQPGYYFYDASNKAIFSLVSSDKYNFEKSYRNSIKSMLAVEYATKLNEVSVLLEIDPFQIQMKDIPLFTDCHQLVLRITANKGDNVMALPESLLNHYTTIIYQTVGANCIELPSYSWFASKNQNTLIVGNGYSQLIIPYASDMTVPNITIQVNFTQANQSYVFIENSRTIAKKLDTQQKLKHIPILNYGWTKWLTEKVLPIAEDQVGHYQKENLAVEPVTAKLSDQRMTEKAGSASFLSQVTAATVSAITTFALTTVMGLSYAFVRRFRRPASPAAIKNTLATVSIPFISQLPVAETRSMSEDKKYGDAAEKLVKTTTAKDYPNGFYESEILEQGFAGLSESWGSVASLFAMEFKKRREERFTRLDLRRKVVLKQIEQMQAQHKLQALVNSFIVCIDEKVKKTTRVNSTELISWIVSHLMDDDYRKYLNDSVSQSGLFKKVEIWLNTFISFQKEKLVQDKNFFLARALSSLSFNEFISHLFIDKVCETYRDRAFSEIEELAEKQKLAMLKIIPVILQKEEALVSSLSVPEGADFIALAENSGEKEKLELASKPRQQMKQKYLPDIKLIFNYFKPLNSTEIGKTITAKKAMQQVLNIK